MHEILLVGSSSRWDGWDWQKVEPMFIGATCLILKTANMLETAETRTLVTGYSSLLFREMGDASVTNRNIVA